MKQLLFIAVLVFASGILQSQDEKINRGLEQFRELKVFDGISVNLIKSNENKAVISGANTTKVAIVNNSGVLKIRMEIDKIFSGYRTFVDLYYSGTLVVIDVNEDARISSRETLQQDVLGS